MSEKGDFGEMKKYKSDNSSIKFLRVFIIVIIICIIIAIKYLLYYIERSDKYFTIESNAPEIIGWIFIAALITAYVVFLFIILPMWYRSVYYVITPDEIIIKSGAIFKNTTYIKISTVQYISTVKCPLSEYTSFNFLLINAYGGRLAMMFLSVSDLEEISKKIQSYLRDRGGL